MTDVRNDEHCPAGFPVLPPTLQPSFHAHLTADRRERLLPALLEFAGTADLERLDADLRDYAGSERLRALAAHGLRGELVYPVPYVLESRPMLLSYYRLLLGFSQKEFYSDGPFGCFKLMETEGRISGGAAARLPDLCRSLIGSAWLLVSEIPELSHEVLHSLALLTLGAQYRGSANVLLGQSMIREVFATVRDIVGPMVEKETATSLVIRNAAGRRVLIEFAPDPDIAIREELSSGRFNNRIAIEVKGGRDISNIHNRLGEAEKSHQKARELGFTQFWTLVNVQRLDLELARRESPTTTQFFAIHEVTDPDSPEHERFRELLEAELGI